MKFLNKRQTVTCSMRTAFMMISFTLSSDGLCIKCLNMRQAKSQCKPWKKFQKTISGTDLKEHRVSGITFAMLLFPTHNFLPKQRASQASCANVGHSSCEHWWEPLNYFRGSKIKCQDHSYASPRSTVTRLHTLVSFIVCLFLNILLF